MPQQKHLSNNEKTKPSLTEKKQPIIEDIKNEQTKGLKRNTRFHRSIVQK